MVARRTVSVLFFNVHVYPVSNSITISITTPVLLILLQRPCPAGNTENGAVIKMLTCQFKMKSTIIISQIARTPPARMGTSCWKCLPSISPMFQVKKIFLTSFLLKSLLMNLCNMTSKSVFRLVYWRYYYVEVKLGMGAYL